MCFISVDFYSGNIYSKDKNRVLKFNLVNYSRKSMKKKSKFHPRQHIVPVSFKNKQ